MYGKSFFIAVGNGPGFLAGENVLKDEVWLYDLYFLNQLATSLLGKLYQNNRKSQVKTGKELADRGANSFNRFVSFTG